MDVYLEILGDVQYPRDIQGVIRVILAKCLGQVRRLDLPNTHKDQLMVRMAV
jgi:hypothetical protein